MLFRRQPFEAAFAPLCLCKFCSSWSNSSFILLFYVVFTVVMIYIIIRDSNYKGVNENYSVGLYDFH